MRGYALIITLSFLCSGVALAEPTLVQRLEGSAAQCSITGSGNHTQASIARRDFGGKSKKYEDLLKKAYSESVACVDGEKTKIKPYLKDQIAQYPQLKPAMTEAYAAWLGYMDWLSTPREWGAESAEEAKYESALNKLKAEVDTM